MRGLLIEKERDKYQSFIIYYWWYFKEIWKSKNN